MLQTCCQLWWLGRVVLAAWVVGEGCSGIWLRRWMQVEARRGCLRDVGYCVQWLGRWVGRWMSGFVRACVRACVRVCVRAWQVWRWEDRVVEGGEV